MGCEAFTVNFMARGKVPGPDNILMETIKDGNNVINKNLSSACIKRGELPQQWKEANMIILHKRETKKI